jgi:hypothetical protein
MQLLQLAHLACVCANALIAGMHGNSAKSSLLDGIAEDAFGTSTAFNPHNNGDSNSNNG